MFWVARSRLTFKREIPWSISWSHDGSLLAVGFGAYVAIYDPPSNALIRTFATSELRGPVRSVHFLGHEGRFLAVAGRSDVVLWDLVTQKGKLHMYLTLSYVQNTDLPSSMAPPECTPNQRCYFPSQR